MLANFPANRPFPATSSIIQKLKNLQKNVYFSPFFGFLQFLKDDIIFLC